MKKIMGIVMAMVLLLGLAGCGVDTSVQMPKEQAMRCADLVSQLADDGAVSCDVQASFGEKDFNTYFGYWYDIPMEFIADGAISYVNAGDNADEISVLYPTSSVSYSTVKKALVRRQERRVKDFKNLIDAEMQKVQRAVIAENEGFILFAVSDDVQSVVDAFMELTSTEKK